MVATLLVGLQVNVTSQAQTLKQLREGPCTLDQPLSNDLYAQLSAPTAAKGLVSGIPQTDRLASKLERRYFIQVPQGEFLRVIVNQELLDVSVSAAPRGDRTAKAITVDRLNGSEGPESLSVLAPVSETYDIVVKAVSDFFEIGGFTIVADGPRLPTESDLKRLRAERSEMEGIDLLESASQQSSVDSTRLSTITNKFKESEDLFHEVGDTYEEALAVYSR
ncbi:MAG: hypothetical protein ACREDR_20690, partial [Blastocatellia bacterium]